MPRNPRKIPWLETRDGVYYVFWYDEATRRTKRLSLGTRDDQEAQDRYVAFLSEGRSLLRRPRHAGLTVAEVLDCYLEEHVETDKVADKYRQRRAAEALKGIWGDTPVHVIDIPESRRYLKARGRATPPAGPTTVRRELNTLVAACNHAIRWRRLEADRMPNVELPAHAPKDEAAFLTKPEIRALIAEASKDPDPRLRAFVILAYMAGARRKSIERLTVAQADLHAMRLHLDPPGAAKTKKRRPIVPITDEMATEIRKLKLHTETEWLFGSSGFDVYKRFRKLCEAIGAEGRHNPHILRHSRATHMLQDGETIFAVAQLLGDTTETVERTYGHRSPDYLAGRRGFRGLDGVLG